MSTGKSASSNLNSNMLPQPLLPSSVKEAMLLNLVSLVSPSIEAKLCDLAFDLALDDDDDDDDCVITFVAGNL